MISQIALEKIFDKFYQVTLPGSQKKAAGTGLGLPISKGIAIIIFTARAQKSDQELGFEVGANAYITKSFEAKEFLEKIKSLLGEQ